MIKDYPYYVFDKELPLELCQEVIKLGEDAEVKRAMVYEDGKDKSDLGIRNNSISWLNYTEINTLLAVYAARANKESGWDLDVEAFETPQFCRYEPGQYYDWHIDTGVDESEELLYRKLSIVVSLNENYTGGDFEMGMFCPPDSPNRSMKIPQLRNTGTIVVFPSFMYHRVVPVDQGTRYSIVCWFRGPNFT